MQAAAHTQTTAHTTNLDAIFGDDGLSLDDIIEETEGEAAAGGVLAGVGTKLFSLKALRATLAAKGIKNTMRRLNKTAMVSVRVAKADVAAAVVEISALGLDVVKGWNVAGGFAHLHLDANQFFNAALGLKAAACAKPYSGKNKGFTPVLA